MEASSSTVRAELAELEERGMLDHPHTSAGRVPTEAGYRRYAAELVRVGVPVEPLPVDLSTARHELDTALRATTEALASMTQLLAAVSAPSLGTTEVRHVELLRLQPNVVMAVVITATGGVAKRLFVFEGPVDSGLVDWATTYLAETVTGLRLGARQLASRLVDSSLGSAERSFLETLAPVFTELTDDGPGGLIIGGTASLLSELRRRDVDTIRDVVAALEERIDLLARPARRARRRPAHGPHRRRALGTGAAAALAGDGELRPREPAARDGLRARPDAHGLRRRAALGAGRGARALRFRRGAVRLELTRPRSRRNEGPARRGGVCARPVVACIARPSPLPVGAALASVEVPGVDSVAERQEGHCDEHDEDDECDEHGVLRSSESSCGF